MPDHMTSLQQGNTQDNKDRFHVDDFTEAVSQSLKPILRGRLAC